jgi:hypothetical protein
MLLHGMLSNISSFANPQQKDLRYILKARLWRHQCLDNGELLPTNILHLCLLTCVLDQRFVSGADNDDEYALLHKFSTSGDEHSKTKES